MYERGPYELIQWGVRLSDRIFYLFATALEDDNGGRGVFFQVISVREKDFSSFTNLMIAHARAASRTALNVTNRTSAAQLEMLYISDLLTVTSFLLTDERMRKKLGPRHMAILPSSNHPIAGGLYTIMAI